MGAMENLAINWPPSGRYILAVSGGADSMVLFHVMGGAATQRQYELVVAHLDHGLRTDSKLDRELVQKAALAAQLPFEYHEAKLPADTSEAAARSTRYGWLEQVRTKHQAAAIVTAHHQDDLIETSLLNLIRGSDRRGLAPMMTGSVIRPLLRVGRAQLRAYAAAHYVAWREDSTNTDTTNPRNALRHGPLANVSPDWRTRYLECIERLTALNQTIDQTLIRQLESARADSSAIVLPRSVVRDLEMAELAEVIVAAARRLRPTIELDRRLLREVTLFAKTGRLHRRRPLRSGLQVVVEAGSIRIEAP